MAKIKRAAIYLRVSTLDQDFELQRAEIQQLVEARGWVVHKVYEEKLSGTHTNRPLLKQLLNDARLGKIDVVLIWKLDRIYRSLRDCLNGLYEFAEYGVELVSLNDSGIDTSTPSGKLLLQILGAFAEFEAGLIKMRVKAGLQAAKAKGVRLGRPKRRDDRRIGELRAAGCSIREIARQTGVSTMAVQRSLKGVTKT